MGRSRKEIMEQFPKIKQMYDNGCKIDMIAKTFGVSKESIYNAFTINGMSLKKTLIDESKLVYADNKPPVLEKVILYGKWEVKNGIRCRKNSICTDITPVFAPR